MPPATRIETPSAITRREALSFEFGRAEADYWVRLHRPAMACRFEIVLSGEDSRFLPAAREALDEVARLEGQLSVFRPDSEVARLNARAAREAVAVEAGLFALLERCRELHRATDGAFDVTSTPLSRCWGFLQREGQVASDAAIDAALHAVGMRHVALDGERRSVAFLRPGMELSFGSIGKGFALDRAARVLRAGGVAHALLSAGRSSVLALGGRDGGFRVDVVSPRRGTTPLARLRLQGAALGTSGAGIQFVVADGRRHGHVLDPRSGRPASGVLSASVVASDAATADGLSTAFLVGGLELAGRYCDAHPGVLALITPEGENTVPRVLGAHPGARLEES